MDQLIKNFQSIIGGNKSNGEKNLKINEFMNVYAKIKSIPSELVDSDIVQKIYNSFVCDKNDVFVPLKICQIRDIYTVIFRNEDLNFFCKVNPVILCNKNTVCRCGGKMRLRNSDKPNKATIYDEKETVEAYVYTKICSRCKQIYYPGYGVLDGECYYDIDWKENWCFFSSNMTGFTMSFLKHTDVLTYRCNVSITGRADAHSLENGFIKQLCGRFDINKTRLEEGYKKYCLVNFLTRHNMFKESSETKDKWYQIRNDVDEAINEIFSQLKLKFIESVKDHKCDVQGCGSVFICDADQKLTRKKCASKFGFKDISVGDSTLQLHIKTGCIETPKQTERLCNSCSAVHAEKDDDEGFFMVENILSHKLDKKKTATLYLVKWLGYEESENTWEPVENIPQILIKKYHKFGRCNITGEIIQNKVVNGTRMAKVKWNINEESNNTNNIDWVQHQELSTVVNTDLNTVCNTSKEKNRFHARTAGILVGGFPCGTVTLVDEIYGSESLSQVAGHVATNMDMFPAIECLVYDDACHLKRFVDKRFSDQRIGKIKMKIDRLHFKNHTDQWCKENCDPNKEVILNLVNTEKMEQLFSWLSSFSYMVRYMKQTTYSFFLLDMIDKHNFNISGQNPF